MRTMEQAITRAMAAGDIQTALQSQAIDPATMSRDEFTAFVEQEIARAKSLVGTVKADAH
jgi:tripartite-type tricarboxylate transporter receptor subunit TctC